MCSRAENNDSAEGTMRKVTCLAIALILVGCDTNDDEFAFERINPDDLSSHPAFSHVTTVSGDAKLIYIAGQTDVASDHVPGANDCRHDDMRGQTMGVMDNVGHALVAAGATWDDVVFIRRFVLDVPEYRQAMGELPSVWENRPPPPSTLIGVTELAEPCFLVEIDVFAAVAGDD